MSENQDQQRRESLETLKIQRVDNGYIVRVPLKGVKVFINLSQVTEFLHEFYGGKK